MNAKPWADPGSPLEVRIVATELAIANVDTGEQRRAIMRELVESVIEDAASVANEMAFDALADRIRRLKHAP